MEELRRIPCILISSKEQQNEEQEYYQNTLDFGGSYLFAENLEEGPEQLLYGRVCRDSDPVSGKSVEKRL